MEVDKPWIVRDFVDELEERRGLLRLLSSSYVNSKAGARAGVKGTREDISAQREALASRTDFMAAHAPIWDWLLDNADVQVVCDAERLEAIYAWAITSAPNVVHAVGAKYSAIKEGLAGEMISDLLGARLTALQVVTLELPQMHGERPGGTLKTSCIMQRPAHWFTDPTWLLTRMLGGPR